MNDTPRMKRPASHQWAIVVYVSILVVNGLLAAVDGLYAFRVTRDPLTMGLIVLCNVQLAGAIFAPRANWHFALGVGVLWAVVLRALYYAVVGPWRALAHGGDLLPPLLNTLMVALLAWLAYAYTFGKASRAYFGFDAGR